MDKKHFASLMEDHSPGPSTDALRPLSPFRNRRRSGTHGEDEANTYGTSSHTGLGPDLDLGQDHQAELSCVYVSSCHLPPSALLGLTMRAELKKRPWKTVHDTGSSSGPL